MCNRDACSKPKDSRLWCSLCEDHHNDPTGAMHDARHHPDTYSPPQGGVHWG